MVRAKFTIDLSASRHDEARVGDAYLIRGDHLLANGFVILIRSMLRERLNLLCALVLAFLVGAFAPVAQEASVKAPSLATTVLNAEALAAPGDDTGPAAVIPQGAEVELTSDATPEFLAMYYDGEAVWVPAQYLSTDDRPGIDSGVTVADIPFLEAPMPEASVRLIIHEGQGVILTGESIYGYDAAPQDDSGGWIDARDLSQ
jgi:uncharacterized protein YraI